MFTIDPPPASRSSGTAAFAHSHAPLTLTSRTRSHSSSSIASNGRRARPSTIAALLTSASSPPSTSRGGRRERPRLLGVGDVGRRDVKLAAPLGRALARRCQPAGAYVGGDHARAEVREVERELAPEPLAGAGDDHALAREPRLAHHATNFPRVAGRGRSPGSSCSSIPARSPGPSAGWPSSRRGCRAAPDTRSAPGSAGTARAGTRSCCRSSSRPGSCSAARARCRSACRHAWRSRYPRHVRRVAAHSRSTCSAKRCLIARH